MYIVCFAFNNDYAILHNLYKFYFFILAGNNGQTSQIKSTEATRTSEVLAEPQSSVEPGGPSVNVFTTDYGKFSSVSVSLIRFSS